MLLNISERSVSIVTLHAQKGIITLVEYVRVYGFSCLRLPGFPRMYGSFNANIVKIRIRMP